MRKGFCFFPNGSSGRAEINRLCIAIAVLQPPNDKRGGNIISDVPASQCKAGIANDLDEGVMAFPGVKGVSAFVPELGNLVFRAASRR